jgi:hypothetical protein
MPESEENHLDHHSVDPSGADLGSPFQLVSDKTVHSKSTYRWIHMINGAQQPGTLYIYTDIQERLVTGNRCSVKPQSAQWDDQSHIYMLAERKRFIGEGSG